LFEWSFVNFITEIFCVGTNSIKLHYISYTKKPKILEEINENISITQNNYSAPHMLAGNKMRLKKNISINPNIGIEYDRLNKKQKKMAKMVEFFFPFWNN
jgi:hypothetical protein